MMNTLDFHINPEGNEIFKIVVSVIAGCLFGIEREIRGKFAGFRTIGLICLGATVFTICSYLLGVTDNRDRIAANIITGVGFIGAGVIFRNNASISGITTAATVWVAAALGMLIGINQYVLACLCLGMGLFILYALDFLQIWIDDRFQHRAYHITLSDMAEREPVLAAMKENDLKINTTKLTRIQSEVVMDVIITGRRKSLEHFNGWLLQQPTVISFSW
jgi:putative Mg2+ transporter-C (MgtC) family protein